MTRWSKYNRDKDNLSWLAELAFDYAEARTTHAADSANSRALELAKNPEQYRLWGELCAAIEAGRVEQLWQAIKFLEEPTEDVKMRVSYDQ